MKISKETSTQISAVSFLSALLVVAAHSGVGGLATTIFPSYFYLSAVPFFFCLSGFLMFKDYRFDISWYKSALSKRLLSLYVPYLLWNLLYYLLKTGQGCKTMSFSIYAILDAVLKISGVDIFSDPPCGPFWYVRALLLFSLMSIIIGRILYSRCGMAVIVCILLAYVLFDEVRLFRTGLKLSSLTYYAFGAYLALSERMRNRCGDMLSKKWLKCVLALFIVCFYVDGFYDRIHCAAYVAVRTFISVLFVWVAYPCYSALLSRVKSLWGLTFFIYGFHAIGITVMHMAHISHYHIVMLGSIVMCLFFGLLVRRFLPKAFGLACGGRDR